MCLVNKIQSGHSKKKLSVAKIHKDDERSKVESFLQYYFHTCPTVLKDMSDDELAREWAKLQYILELKNESYKKLEKKNERSK